ncbi:MAG: glycosyltransferase [Chlorobi bacterium]|nr:glycosyltransferase [Chlorobiota bacterium]
MSVTFDVIVPTYDNPDELAACLDGLAQQTFRNFRVLLCIDGESPGVRRLVERTSFPFDVVVLSHPALAHRGRNATRNLALTAIRSPLLAMLDSDVVPSPRWLDEHYALLRQDCCISLGDIRYTNTQDNVWARYIQTRGKNKYHHRDRVPYYYFTTGNVALASKYFVQVGGQDEHMRSYGGGDTELAIRLQKAFTLPVIFNAQAVGWSHMNKTLVQALEQLQQFGGENLPYIVGKHPEVREIFGVEYLRGQRIRDRLLRMLARSPMPDVLLRCVPNPIAPVERAIIHFAVFSAIARGWMYRDRGAAAQ